MSPGQTELSRTADQLRRALESEKPGFLFQVDHDDDRDVFDVVVVDPASNRRGPLLREGNTGLAAAQPIDDLIAVAVQAIRKW